MTDAETLAVYDAKIDDYKKLTAAAPGPALLGFMNDLPKGVTVLDLGCGPGFAAAELARNGFDVIASDASAEMAKAAGEHDGVTARCEDFAQLPDRPTYHGVYANFSLLHVDRDEFIRLISRCHKALHPNGIFHIGMKMGTGAGRDAMGRFYTYYTFAELTDILTAAGFTITWHEQGQEMGLAGRVDPFVLMRAHA